jgi:hypothetical protein
MRLCFGKRKGHMQISPWRWVALALLGMAGMPGAHAADKVDITIPVSVSFAVNNISATTTGAPATFTVTFSNAKLKQTDALRISVMADSTAFTPPSGTTQIPASSVTWTTSNAVHGAGSNGTLSATQFTQVYQSDLDPSSGSVAITWRLTGAPVGIYSGSHTLSLTWKLEAVTP